MDDNTNIFAEPDTSGHAGGPAKSDTDNSANHDGPAGRIDLALARDAQGGGAVGGSNGDNGNGNVAAGTTGPEPTKRGRGRPRKDGQPNNEPITEKDKTPRNIRATFIERTLYSIHLAGAAMIKCPELKLDKDDAKDLGEAVAGVLALHKVRMTPGQEAYAILMETAARVYPPMVISIYIRKKAEIEGKGKVLQWPAKNGPTVVPKAPAPLQQEPQQPAPKTADPSLLPAGFNPLNIKLDQ